MVFFMVNDKICAFIKEAIAKDKSIEAEIRPYLELDAHANAKLIPHNSLYKVSRVLEQDFRAVLSCTELYFCPEIPHETPRNPELEARLKKLKEREENRLYSEMVRDVCAKTKYEMSLQGNSLSVGIHAFKNQLSMGANILVTMGTCFAIGYFLGNVFFSGNQTYALIGGLIGLVIAVFMDSILVITRVYAIDKAEEKKKN